MRLALIRCWTGGIGDSKNDCRRNFVIYPFTPHPPMLPPYHYHRSSIACTLISSANLGKANTSLHAIPTTDNTPSSPDHGAKAVDAHGVAHADSLEDHAQWLQQPDLGDAVQGIHWQQGWDWGVQNPGEVRHSCAWQVSAALSGLPQPLFPSPFACQKMHLRASYF